MEHYGLAHVSTGDMLRAAVSSGDELAKRLEGIMRSGQLVDDATIEEVLRARLQKSDCAKGYVLDGVPRTMAQAHAVDRVNEELGCGLDCVLQLKVSDSLLVRRLTGRRVHPKSGRVYHIEFNPPKQEGVDDVSGEPLQQRSDDSEEVVRERLTVYKQDTQPLLSHYEQRGLLSVLEAEDSVAEVKEKLRAMIDQRMSGSE